MIDNECELEFEGFEDRWIDILRLQRGCWILEGDLKLVWFR